MAKQGVLEQVHEILTEKVEKKSEVSMDRIHRDGFLHQLVKHGFNPIAMVPTDFIEPLFKKLKFYQLFGLVDNNTKSNSPVFSIFGLSLFTMLLALILGGITLFFGGSMLLSGLCVITVLFTSILCYSLDDGNGNNFSTTYSILTLILAFASAILFFWVILPETKFFGGLSVVAGIIAVVFNIIAVLVLSELNNEIKFFKRICKQIFKLIPHGLLCRILWPKLTDKDAHGNQIKITYPLGASFNCLVHSARRRCNSDRVYIALPSQAIAFDYDQLAEKCRVDPILCYISDDNKWTAILGQSGDFPDEKLALEMARNYKFND